MTLDNFSFLYYYYYYYYYYYVKLKVYHNEFDYEDHFVI